MEGGFRFVTVGAGVGAKFAVGAGVWLGDVVMDGTRSSGEGVSVAGGRVVSAGGARVVAAKVALGPGVAVVSAEPGQVEALGVRVGLMEGAVVVGLMEGGAVVGVALVKT